MRVIGVNYDTGFFPGTRASRPTFQAEDARRELQIIARDLHCGAVRVSGGDPSRLAVAARHAADAGLEVWYSPFPAEKTAEELIPYLAGCAADAEEVRRAGAEVVFVTGAELSVFASGFIPGEDAYRRMAVLGSADPEVWASLAAVPERVNAFLGEAANAVRARFRGRVTYASAPWEDIDWTPFDIVSVDAYRDAQNAASYRDDLRRHAVHGKPVTVTEFGCCTYRGAMDRGAMGWAIVDESAEPPRITADLVRDEAEQVRYMTDLLEVFDEEGLDGAFWYTFSGYRLTHRADPHHDLDLASYGLVRMLEHRGESGYGALGWEPKKAFHALAAECASRTPESAS